MSWSLTIKGLGLGAIFAFIIVVLLPRSVVIEPISVPKDMAEKGYTPNIAALHLLDAMNKYAVRARTSGAGPKLALHKDPADFVLPFVGVSFKAVVEWIRTFVRIEGRQNISGEITRVDEKLRLRLRKNAVVIYESAVGVHQSSDLVDAKDVKEALKALFDGAALGVFANTDPYFEAIANSDKNPEAALELAKRIIADWPASDQNVVWAHNLLGFLLYQKGKLDGDTGAVAEFKKVRDYPGLWDDARVAIAHLNLGLAYSEQGRTNEAVNEFHSAIRIRPELGTAHQLLGDVLDQMGDAEKAGCEYLEAIAKFHQTMVSNRFSAVAHQGLGTALNNWDKAKAAKCPSHSKGEQKDPVPYDTVIAEYQRAAELDPDDAHIHYDLGSKLLESPGLVDKSINELREALKRSEGPQEALKRGEGPSDSFDEFKYVLLKTLSHALRIKTRNRGAVIDCLKGKFEHQEADELFCQAFHDNEALIGRAEKKALIDRELNDNAAAYKRRGVDLYLMGKFEEAVAAHKMAIGIDETYLADRIDRGYARFALADFAGAADDFAHALKLPWGQADKMVWLYLSRKHSRNIPGDEKYDQQQDRRHPDASAEPADNASKLLKSNRQDWRIKLFRDNQLPEGVREPDDVLRKVKGTDEQCKTYFYIGEWHALRQELEAVAWLKRAETACPLDLVERPAVTAELKRLGPAEGVAAMGASPGISTDRRRSRR